MLTNRITQTKQLASASSEAEYMRSTVSDMQSDFRQVAERLAQLDEHSDSVSVASVVTF
jgi:hypothetical protein